MTLQESFEVFFKQVEKEEKQLLSEKFGPYTEQYDDNVETECEGCKEIEEDVFQKSGEQMRKSVASQNTIRAIRQATSPKPMRPQIPTRIRG